MFRDGIQTRQDGSKRKYPDLLRVVPVKHAKRKRLTALATFREPLYRSIVETGSNHAPERQRFELTSHEQFAARHLSKVRSVTDVTIMILGRYISS